MQSNIPIPVATQSQQQEIVSLVDKILEAKKDCRGTPDNDSKVKSDNDSSVKHKSGSGKLTSNDSRLASTPDSSEIEDEIDKKVYALYGLTEEEIKIVENSAK